MAFKNHYSQPWKDQTARQVWRCTWCGKDIAKGELYSNWTSPRSNDGTFGGVNKVHRECMPALLLGSYEYKPFNNARNPRKPDRPPGQVFNA